MHGMTFCRYVRHPTKPKKWHLLPMRLHAARADAAALNAGLGAWRGTSDDGYPIISNKRPGYCSVYASHEYTAFDDDLPRYVGTPEERGYWVEAKDYDRELAKYEKELAERKEREQNAHSPGFGMVGN